MTCYGRAAHELESPSPRDPIRLAGYCYYPKCCAGDDSPHENDTLAAVRLTQLPVALLQPLFDLHVMVAQYRR